MARTKFNVDKDKSKRTYNNIVFDSILEMRYFRDVILPKVESGEIVEYELQKPYELQPKFIKNGKTVQAIKYVADFVVTYADGSIEIIDTKGMPDSVAKIKRKMFWYLYPDSSYHWVTFSAVDGGWCEYEYVQAQRKLRKAQKASKNKEN